MVRLYFQVIAALALLAGSAADDNNCKQIDTAHGNLMANKFSTYDIADVTSNITLVTIFYGRRVNGISISFDREIGEDKTYTFGKQKDDRLDYKLADGEHIVQMRVQLVRKKGSDRVSYVHFDTNQHHSFAGGRENGSGGKTFKAAKDFHLIGLRGNHGDELDALGPVWGNPTCTQSKAPK